MPGFTPISMFPKCWVASGLSYGDLITELVEAGLRALTQPARELDPLGALRGRRGESGLDAGRDRVERRAWKSTVRLGGCTPRRRACRP